MSEMSQALIKTKKSEGCRVHEQSSYGMLCSIEILAAVKGSWNFPSLSLINSTVRQEDLLLEYSTECLCLLC